MSICFHIGGWEVVDDGILVASEGGARWLCTRHVVTNVSDSYLAHCSINWRPHFEDVISPGLWVCFDDVLDVESCLSLEFLIVVVPGSNDWVRSDKGCSWPS